MCPYCEIATRLGIAALVGAVISFMAALFVQKGNRRIIIVLLCALSLVGASAGIAGGMSRTGAVGAIVPAFLGLLGGVAIYLFGVDSHSKGIIASLGAAALSISLVAGYSLAAQYRKNADDHKQLRSICAKAYTDADLLGNPKSFEIFYERMGQLCFTAMTWQLSGKPYRINDPSYNSGK